MSDCRRIVVTRCSIARRGSLTRLLSQPTYKGKWQPGTIAQGMVPGRRKYRKKRLKGNDSKGETHVGHADPNCHPGTIASRIGTDAGRLQGHRRAQPEAAAGIRRTLQGRWTAAGRPAASHPDLHGLHGQDAGRPQPARSGADGALAAIPEAVAGHRPAHDGPAGRAGGRAGQGRQALQRSGLEGRGRLRLSQAVLPADRALAAAHRQGGRGRRRQDRPEGRLLHATVHRRAVAFQLRADQSAGRQGHGRVQGREPGEGPAEPADRPRARQGQARDPPDRHEGLQGRRERRHLARQGRLPERADPAHPVRADDRRGLHDAAADRAAVDQQVLHPRPQARELVHQMGDRAGLHGVRDLLGQSRRAADQAGLRGLHEARPPGRARRHREGDRPAPGIGDRLLHRRHADGRDAGLHGGARRRPDRRLHLLHRAGRLHANRASSASSSTRTSSPASRR